jgi:uncharacterized tellurite resistance protein B-like protein
MARMSITSLVPATYSPAQGVADVLLELAFLVAVADGQLVDEELAAFETLVGRLRGPDANVSDLMSQFASPMSATEIEARVRELSARVPDSDRELAYTLALSMALVDHDPSDAEDHLHRVLGETLSVSPERREALSREVGFGGGKAG